MPNAELLSPVAPPMAEPQVSARDAIVALVGRLHDTVGQRLAGLSLLLASDAPLGPDLRDRGRAEVAAALAELRQALDAGLSGGAPARPTAAEEIERLRAAHPGVVVDWEWRDRFPVDIGPTRLIDALVAEAVRNARKHATPTRVAVELELDAETATVSVINDGARQRPTGAGMGLGLRLLQIEAGAVGGLIESGPHGAGCWRVALILPRYV